MYDMLGAYLDGTLNGFVGGVVGRLAVWLAGMGIALLTWRVLWFSFSVLHGEVHEPVLEFLRTHVKAALIVLFSLTPAIYMDYVVTLVNDAVTSLTLLFVQPNVDLANLDSSWKVLSALSTQTGELTAGSFKAAVTGLNFVALASGFMIALGNWLFETAALLTIIVTKTLLTFTLSIGPLFIFPLLFRWSEQYFRNWVGLTLSAVMLCCLVFFVLGLAVMLAGLIIEMARADLGTLNMVAVAGQYLAAFTGLALFLVGSTAYAAFLAQGSPVSLGTQMFSQLYSMWKLSHLDRAAVQPPSNSIGRGHSIPYRMGAAFQRAAQRGRSNQ